MFNLEHFNWCSHYDIRVYPVALKDTMYSGKSRRNGRIVKANKPFVELVVEIGGRQKRVSELPHLKEVLSHTEDSYMQDEVLLADIHRIYKYYYDRGYKAS